MSLWRKKSHQARKVHLGLWIAGAQHPCLPFQEGMRRCSCSDIVCFNKYFPNGYTVHIRVSRFLWFPLCH